MTFGAFAIHNQNTVENFVPPQTNSTGEAASTLHVKWKLARHARAVQSWRILTRQQDVNREIGVPESQFVTPKAGCCSACEFSIELSSFRLA